MCEIDVLEGTSELRKHNKCCLFQSLFMLGGLLTFPRQSGFLFCSREASLESLDNGEVKLQSEAAFQRPLTRGTVTSTLCIIRGKCCQAMAIHTAVLIPNLALGSGLNKEDD